MSPLFARIAEEIGARGPMRLDRFWNLALFDPEGGYYARRDPFGAAGDFVTAPEVSQMFGELIGAWLVAAWRSLGRPAPFTLAEMGPGRGTLMADLLRTARRLDIEFFQAARIRLIETSDRLAAAQIERLAPFDLPIVRLRQLEEIEAHPLLLVANELLDAVAIRQWVFAKGAWRERFIALGNGDALTLVDGPPLSRVPASLAALGAPEAVAVFEMSPERDRLAATLGQTIRRQRGAALLIDYGHARTGFGDTLQALRGHAFAPVLERPGEADITSHVDFGQVGAVLRTAGIEHLGLARQGDFLLGLGLLERAGSLGREADAAGREALSAAVRRLAGTGEGEMGELFKVLALASEPLALPPFAGEPSVD